MSQVSHDRYIFIRCPTPPYKILTVACEPSKKISEVKNEIHTLLGLYPTEYILQVSEKSTKLTFDDCTLADYNIHKDTTLEIKLLHPTAEPRVGLNGGAEDKSSHEDIDKRFSNSEVSSDSNVSSSGDDGHNRQESNISSSVHQVSFMIRLPSVKIITVRFNLFETTIGEVKSEIQNQFGLCPSQYILKLGYKKLASDNCSLADYNIQERNTLDIVLRAISSLPAGGTDANDDERDPLYDWSTNSPDEIDERLKKKISELDDKHGLHLQERSNEELKYVLRDKPEADRKHVMRDFKVQSSITQNKTQRRFTCDELITNFLDQKREGFPRLRGTTIVIKVTRPALFNFVKVM